MKKLYIILLVAIMIINTACGSKTISSEEYNLEVDKGLIYGTLTTPKSNSPYPVALIIQGSGPTDRDGNNHISGNNNNLKMIAEELATNGIASVRYDKRGIGDSMSLVKSEAELVFEDYVNDAILWVEKLQKDSRFNKVYVIGHSEGAQIGAIAASKTDVDGFISIAGIGESVYDTLVRQLQVQPEILERSIPILEELKKGNLVENTPVDLAALFRESIQPYLISWFKYDPAVEIDMINAPVLIIQGDNDIQVQVNDAEILYDARRDKENTKLVIVEGMNHVLKDAARDPEKNLETYSDPKLPLSEELMTEIVNFINN